LASIIERDSAHVLSNFLVASSEKDVDAKYIPPVVIDFKSDMHAFKHSASMESEIFGPILPIVRYETMYQCVTFLEDHSRLNGSPLALYVFTRDGAGTVRSQIMPACPSGGVVVNDCSMHIAEGCLPFGGIGNSGIGKYHDAKTFEIFSHYRPVLWKSGFLDIPSRYPPYNRMGIRVVGFLLWMSRKNITPWRVFKWIVLMGLVYKIVRR
jgi:aldehyde dehydrogenase (NAD+)